MPDWLLDWLQSVSGTVIGNLLVALIVGYVGLIVWKYQTIFKRRTEVAEKARMTFAQVEDALSAIRNPFGTSLEDEAVVIPEDFKGKEGHYREYGKFFNRLEKNAAAFESIWEILESCRIHLGQEAADALFSLHVARNRVLIAAGYLANTKKGSYGESPEETAQAKAFWMKQRSTLYEAKSMPEYDTLTVEIAEARQKLEAACHPYLELPAWRTALPWFNKRKVDDKVE